MDNTVYWLWLTMIFGVGSNRLWEAVKFYGSPEIACEDLKGECRISLSDREKNNILSTPLQRAFDFLRECESKNICVTGFDSEDYPQDLKFISDPPAVLYSVGNIGCLNRFMNITAVGTRKPREYSIIAARKICRELAEINFVIVSGFAMGIDIAAQLSAAEINCPTVSVLGCGVDYDYPKENIKYRNTIIQSGGAIISEYPPGTPPNRGNFPRRNRILSGVSRAVIVFEASAISGSLITANLAAEQGRNVFCLPPQNIFSKEYQGNIALLRDGALPLYCCEDVIEQVISQYDISDCIEGYTYSVGEDSLKIKSDASVKKESLPEKQIETEIEKKTEKTENTELFSELTGVQRDIAELLREHSLHADIISQKLSLDMGELLMELTEMEMMGVVCSLPGKMYGLCL